MSTTTTKMAGFRQSRWFKLVWIVPIALVVLVIIVLAAKGFRALPAGQSFLKDFPGAAPLPSFAPVGFPAWLAWQHGLNAFFIIFIIRSGWAVRTTARPDAYWTRNNKGRIRTKGQPVRISLNLWMHISLDTLWIINGVLFYVLIFSTGQWTRIIPTSWSVFPNAVSAIVQYASLDWPTENGWANYNAIQVLSYFAVVFLAAPLALITGIRMAPGFAAKFKRFDRVFPLPVARKIHYPVMLFFVAFIIVHVVLVFATGALNNLNHMYAGRNDNSWLGLIIFAVTLVVMIGAWIAVRPLVLRAIAGTFGKVGR
jgi:thiosulfate reductase cytochrome b subunit